MVRVTPIGCSDHVQLFRIFHRCSGEQLEWHYDTPTGMVSYIPCSQDFHVEEPLYDTKNPVRWICVRISGFWG